ncbi:MAG TPA: LacI family DNA-binding transcriptional regulator [Pyrinomonadaceae bacterium]|nr:LacI family DNA-binding transcriptional regulator [Pyrinomonadaceae bacterium]
MAKDADRRITKARIQDVAKLAGVSVATVSRVTTGSDRVSPELRARVLKAASELNVELNGKGKAKIIAFILANRDLFNPFHAGVMVGAEAYCASHDCGLLFLPIHYGSNVPWQNLHLPQILTRPGPVNAAILAGKNSQNLLDLLSHRGISFVVMGNNVIGEWEKDRYSSVYFDDVEGAQDVTRYLLSLGHRDIWYIGNFQMPWFKSRFEGYRRAMEEAGLAPRLNEFASGEGEDLGYLATKSILKSGESITGLFAGDDASARGAYQAIHESGLRIPEDISVVGFNDTEAASLRPPLTSVRVFTEQVGRGMAALAVERLNRPDLPPETITIPTQLVKRESCREIQPVSPAATLRPNVRQLEPQLT